MYMAYLEFNSSPTFEILRTIYKKNMSSWLTIAFEN